MKNAVILAAGRSKKLAPFTYEKPKGLFRVKNEVLIERQISQLKEAGIDDIVIVVGYMKEKFFYLEEKYGVRLIANNSFLENGNLYSLYAAREYLGSTYVCCADHYFLKNPFLEENMADVSYRACSYRRGKFLEFAVDYSEAGVITGFSVGGKDSMAMVGHAYFNASFSRKFCMCMEREISDFGVSRMYWEEFYARHQKELTFYIKEYGKDDILEFESIADLRQFDSEFLYNVDSRIIENICSVLECRPDKVTNIEVIQSGLTNVSFMFQVDSDKYVYRHPGGTAGSLVDRDAEIYAQKKAAELGVDRSVIHIDREGWKLSHYIEETAACDFEKYPRQLETAMEYLRRMHRIKACADIRVKRFDTVGEGKKLMEIASASKGNLSDEFSTLIEKIDRLDRYVRRDACLLGISEALCHNDVYEPNFLATDNGSLYLIDWEYAGMNDPANDIACILCRGSYTDAQIRRYLRCYFQREPTGCEYRHYTAYIALCGFYWFCWGLYKGSVGDDDGFFFLPAYRNCVRFVDGALESYEKDAEWMQKAGTGDQSKCIREEQ